MAPTKVLNCSHGQALSFEHSQWEQLAEGRALREFTPSGSLKKSSFLKKTSFFLPPKYCSMWVLLVPTCEVSGVQTNNCIVAATAIPAASTLSFPSITSIAESLEFDSESLGLLALLSVLRVGV